MNTLQLKNKSRQYSNNKYQKKTMFIRYKKWKFVISKKVNKELDQNVSLLASLVNDFDTIFEDKLEYLKVFYVKWEYKNIKKVVKELKLIF